MRHFLRLRVLALGFLFSPASSAFVIQEQYLKAASITFLDNFGATVDIDGDYAGTEITQNGLFAGAEVSLDYMIGYDEKSGAGITFGVKVGYNHQLSTGNWRSFGNNLGSTVDLDVSSPYARLSIGFAGWHRQ